MSTKQRTLQRALIRRTSLAVLLAGFLSLAVVLVLSFPPATANHSPAAASVAVDTDVTGNDHETIGATEPNGTAEVGDQITVGVVIDNVTNLLGFSFGVDFNRPALKLPFIGRLGFGNNRPTNTED